MGDNAEQGVNIPNLTTHLPISPHTLEGGINEIGKFMKGQKERDMTPLKTNGRSWRKGMKRGINKRKSLKKQTEVRSNVQLSSCLKKANYTLAAKMHDLS